MDPFSIFGAVVTVATFVKDAVELVQTIQRSVGKVAQNKTRVKILTDSIIRTLHDIDKLSQGREDDIAGSEQLQSSLASLREEMISVQRICRTLLPDESGSQLSLVKARVKAWHRREEIEEHISRLKEHVQMCYTQFTAFTSSRTEHTSIRIENALVIQRAENHSRLERLEGLVTHMLLETQFGQQYLERVRIRIEEDVSRESIEYQYLRLQLNKVVDSLDALAVSQHANVEDISGRHELPFAPVFRSAFDVDHENLVAQILCIARSLRSGDPEEISVAEGIADLRDVAISLNLLGMSQESAVADSWVVQIYRAITPAKSSVFLPYLAHALMNLSTSYRDLEEYESAIKSSEDSLASFRLYQETYPEVDLRGELVLALATHARNLHAGGRSEEAAKILEEQADLARELMVDLFKAEREDEENTTLPPATYTLLRSDGVNSSLALTSFETSLFRARLLSTLNRPSDAYAVARDGLRIFFQLSSYQHNDLFGHHEEIFEIIFECLYSMYETHRLPLAMTGELVTTYKDLADISPNVFPYHFLTSLYAYACLCNVDNVLTDMPFITSSEESKLVHFFTVFSQSVRLDNLEKCAPFIADAVYVIFCYDDAISRGSPSTRFYNDLYAFVYRLCIFRLDTFIDVARKLVDDIRLGIKTTQFTEPIQRHMLRLVESGSLTPEQQGDIMLHSARIVDHLRNAMKSDSWILSIDSQFVDAGLRHIRILRECHEYGAALKLGEELFGVAPSISWEYDRVLQEATVDHCNSLHAAGRTEEAIENMVNTLTPTSIYTFGRILTALYRYHYSAGRLKELWGLMVSSNSVESNLFFGAGSLQMLSYWFLAAQRYEMAFLASKQAVLTYWYATQFVDTVEIPALWSYVLQLCRCCLALGQPSDVLTITEKVISYWHKLDSHKRSRLPFLSHMDGDPIIDILDEHCKALAAVGRHEDALRSADEAVSLCRPLSSHCPGFLPNLAQVLHSSAVQKWTLGRQEEALSTCEEAVALWRRWAAPDWYLLPVLCAALSDMSSWLIELGRKDDAAVVEKERAQWIAMIPSATEPEDIEIPESVLAMSDEWETTSLESVLLLFDGVPSRRQDVADVEVKDAEVVSVVSEMTLAVDPDSEHLPLLEVEEAGKCSEEDQGSVKFQNVPRANMEKFDFEAPSPVFPTNKEHDFRKEVRRHVALAANFMVVVWSIIVGLNYLRNNFRTVDTSAQPI